MKSLATYNLASEIDTEINIDFTILNSRIYTTNDISIFTSKKEANRDKTFLCISIEIEIDNFESVLESASYSRPRLLIILGILTLFTQYPFSPLDFSKMFIRKRKLLRTPSTKSRFIIRKKDYLQDLKRIILFLDNKEENEKRLFYSLLDRYRKAIFLEHESEDNMVHDDEVLLSYFHILELLATKYYKKQKELINDSLKQFTEKVFKDIYLLEGNQLEEEKRAKNKIIESIIVSELPISSKILYMFQEQGILTHRFKFLTFELIKDRNAVAHGRQVYQERVIFPIPVFFPLIPSRNYSFHTLKILTGRAISIFVNLENLKADWLDIEKELIPTIEEVNSFLNERKYDNLIIKDFFNGTYNNISPYTIAYYYIVKKIKLDKIISLFSNLVNEFRPKKNEVIQLIVISILISDFVDNKTKDSCIQLLTLAHKKKWLLHTTYRDILYNLEYLGHNPITLRELLTQKLIS